ncbi:MAG: hypothetical protein M3S32_05315 [Acidobacteriota bacterium]|nr:hypothetical protein [Acidobacteriota bacterium]
MSPTDRPHDPHPIQHPDITAEEAARQRGKDPSRTLGPWPRPPIDTRDPDPKFQPDPELLKRLIGEYGELAKRHRPRREDVLPYEMIRAFVPGDRGARPTWPPTPCWESPDVLLIDAGYTGPFDPARCVGSPVSGRAYRMFVRVFNLGLLEGAGTHVRGWYVEPGFFSGQPGYEPHPIGGAYVDLEDRTRPGSHRVVELDLPWRIPASLTGHECLLATVECIADPWSRVFDANRDRHLGQRNLEIAVGAQNLTVLIGLLGGRLPEGGALEILHGGTAVVPLLQAVTGGRLTGRDGKTAGGRLVAADPRTLNHGVPTDAGRHLMTAVRAGSSSMVVPTDVLAAAVLRSRGGGGQGEPEGETPGAARPKPESNPNPFVQHGAAARALRGLRPDAAEEVALVGGALDMAGLLPAALRRMLDLADLRADSMATALGGAKGAAHLLRFVATDERGSLIGGYSIIVA